MFGDFLYLLRRSGLKISLTEWMALMEALTIYGLLIAFMLIGKI